MIPQATRVSLTPADVQQAKAATAAEGGGDAGQVDGRTLEMVAIADGYVTHPDGSIDGDPTLNAAAAPGVAR